MARRNCFTQPLLDEFFGCYFRMYNNFRTYSNPGFTPNEMHRRMSGGDAPVGDWSALRPEALEPPEVWDMLPPLADGSGEAPKKAVQQPVRVTKINRNDPCPCGSGKKYKKCCGR